MKNLLTAPDDSFDVLPIHRSMRRYDSIDTKTQRNAYYDHRNGSDMPYSRVSNFLRSRVGKYWDKVISEYVTLFWVPFQYRNHKKLCEFVEHNTFIEDKEIQFFDNYSYNSSSQRKVKDISGEVFYVHPKSRLLCHKPKIKYRYKKKVDPNFVYLAPHRQLLKLYGIWYLVWAEQLQGWEINYPSDKPLIYESHVRQSLTHTGYDSSVLWKYRPMTIHKKQLNQKELLARSLSNDPPVSAQKCNVCGNEHCTHFRHK